MFPASRIGWVLLAALAAAAAPQPQRIVSTAPGITEILFDLGLEGKVVGVTTFCRYPEAARALPKIGSFQDPDVERIVAQRPDLVLTIKAPFRLTERLRAARVNVVEVNPETMEGLFAAMQAIGDAAGVGQRARERIRELREKLERQRAEAARRPPVRVVFLVGRTPGTVDGLYAAGKGTYLDDLLRVAGGENVLRDAPFPYLKLSLETLIARDPDVIIDMGDAAHADAATRESAESVKRLWAQRLPHLRAVKQGRVVAVANDILVVPGPRILEAVALFRRILENRMER